MRDEPAEMCRAHIVNEALGTCAEWVPQRKDVDNFFGSVVEADFVTIIRNREKELIAILLDPTVKGKIRPKLLDNEIPIGHYLPKPGAPEVEGHTVAKLIDSGELICNLAIKKSEDHLFSLTDSDLAFVIDADFQPEVTASMIKAAHLTLFKLFGYKHVFSVTGRYLASILRDFCEKFNRPDVARYFSQVEIMNMVVPLMEVSERLKGTVTDGRLLSVFGSSGNIYAMGVIVNAGKDTFCVFVPGMERAIDTYFGFLRERPKSIAVKVTQWVQATAREESHFGIPEGEPTRLVFAAEEPRREIRCEPPFVLDSSDPASSGP
jgi:hypothetical protein